MTKFVAQFRIRIDWADDGYQHPRSDVTDLSQGTRIRWGSDVSVSSKEAQIQFGEGRLQLRAQDGIFGSGGMVSQRQLERIHQFRVDETTTNMHVFTGRIEFQQEHYARILDGDVLTFTLYGLGRLKDGGVLTYPKGAANGEPLESGLAVRTSEPRLRVSLSRYQFHAAWVFSTWGKTHTMLDGRALSTSGFLIFTRWGQSDVATLSPATFGRPVMDQVVPGTPTTRQITVNVSVRTTDLNTGQQSTSTSTRVESVPAVNGEIEQDVTWVDYPLIHHDGVLWRVKRARGTSRNVAAAGGYSVTTQTSSAHIITTVSWPSHTFSSSSFDRYEFEGRPVTNATGALALGDEVVPGGEVPSVLVDCDALFSHDGGLFAVDGGNLWAITGFPASAEVSLRGSLPPGCNAPKAGLSVGGRVYLIGNDGRSIWHVGQLFSPNQAVNIGSLTTGRAWQAASFDEIDVRFYAVTAGAVESIERMLRTTAPIPQGETTPDLEALADTLGREYFDESVHSQHPWQLLRAYAEALGVPFEAGASSSEEDLDNLAGLVQYGPQWDIDLVDTAYRGWTGQFLMARHDGGFIAVWPDDVDPAARALRFDEYLVTDPLEVRVNREIITNAIHAQGYEIHEETS